MQTTDVLIVRLDAIGDFLISSGSSVHLAAHWHAQGRRVAIIVNAACVELAQNLGVFDEVWALDRSRFHSDLAYRMALMRRLHSAGFEIAIQPTISRDLLFGDSVVRLAGYEKRIGSSGDLTNRSQLSRYIGDPWYTDLISVSPAEMTELEYNAEFLRGLGITSELKIHRIEIPDQDDTPKKFEEYFVLFPGASWDGKCWPPESFAGLAQRIVQATGWECVIAGGPGDHEAANAVRAAATIPIDNWVGRTTLLGLAALFRDARLVISNDTSAVHMAAAVQTPSFCILGGGHFGRFLPYPEGAVAPIARPQIIHYPMDCFKCDWRCKFSREVGEAVLCIRSITVDQAWLSVGSFIQNLGNSEALISD